MRKIEGVMGRSLLAIVAPSCLATYAISYFIARFVVSASIGTISALFLPNLSQSTVSTRSTI